jgi:hypothetical protein
MYDCYFLIYHQTLADSSQLKDEDAEMPLYKAVPFAI